MSACFVGGLGAGVGVSPGLLMSGSRRAGGWCWFSVYTIACSAELAPILGSLRARHGESRWHFDFGSRSLVFSILLNLLILLLLAALLCNMRLFLNF